MLRICSLIVLVGLAAVPAGAQEISGQMRFIDADTLMLGQVKIRLFGIDAPELDQQCQRADGATWACGRWAADQAKALHDGGSARCTALEKDRYGRTVARCFTGVGERRRHRVSQVFAGLSRCGKAGVDHQPGHLGRNAGRSFRLSRVEAGSPAGGAGRLRDQGQHLGVGPDLSPAGTKVLRRHPDQSVTRRALVLFGS